MGEISNKTLAGLVILAIIISLVGLFIGRARVVTVGKPTETGVVQADVQADVDITVTGTPLSFGQVYAGDIISSDSDDSPATPDLACGDCNKNFVNGPVKLTITVDGTTPTNIGYYSSSSLFDMLLSGADNVGDASEDGSFMAKVKVTTVGTPCNNGIAATSPFNLNENVFLNTHVDSGGSPVPDDVAEYCETSDFLEMYFKIAVPSTEPTGVLRTATITYVGTSAV